ncbi:MAG: DUF2891 family protein [Pirellulales bacterium]
MNRYRTLIFIACLLAITSEGYGQVQDELPTLGRRLSSKQVDAFVQLALKNIDQEYPNKPSITLSGPEQVIGPKQLFHAFYGSFDWHSCVHAHWMLVRLLKLYPDLKDAASIRTKLNDHLSLSNIEAEKQNCFRPKRTNRSSRMYGWAWVSTINVELENSMIMAKLGDRT